MISWWTGALVILVRTEGSVSSMELAITVPALVVGRGSCVMLKWFPVKSPPTTEELQSLVSVRTEVGVGILEPRTPVTVRTDIGDPTARTNLMHALPTHA